MREGLEWGQGSLRKYGRFWTMRYRFEGKSYSESTGTEDYNEARVCLLARLKERGKLSANAAALATEGLIATIGCAAELLVAADLLNRGIEVFRSLSPHSSCDLIAVRNNRLARIEVKTGPVKKIVGTLMRPREPLLKPLYLPKIKQRGKYDIHAVVDRKSGIHYFPPLDEFFLPDEAAD